MHDNNASDQSNQPLAPDLRQVTTRFTRTLKFAPQSQTAFKTRTRFKSEYHIQSQIPDQTIDSNLAMLALNFGQNQLGRIGVVKTAEIGLNLEQLTGAIESHLGVKVNKGAVFANSRP